MMVAGQLSPGDAVRAAVLAATEYAERYGAPVVVRLEEGRALGASYRGREPWPALPSRCSVCGGPQFSTPAGATCPNGHGGAESDEP